MEPLKFGGGVFPVAKRTGEPRKVLLKFLLLFFREVRRVFERIPSIVQLHFFEDRHKTQKRE